MKSQVFTQDEVEYELLQSPHISDCGKFYEANATNSDNYELVTLYWNRTNPDHEDESMACDWNDFEVV